MRGVRQLLSGKGVQKEKKRCKITRNSPQGASPKNIVALRASCFERKVGAEGSRTDCEKSQSTLGETVVSRGGGNTSALWSLTQEEPPTTTRLRA